MEALKKEVQETLNSLTYDDCLLKKMKNQGKVVRVQCADPLNQLLVLVQEEYKGETNRTISKEKIFYKLAILGIETLLHNPQKLDI